MDNKDLIGKEIQATPKPTPEVGADVNNVFTDILVYAAASKNLDISALENFTNVTMTRESIYRLIDQMAQDSTISSILETYSEDVCQPNDEGKIVWCESVDTKVADYVNYLLDVLNVDKHIYNWVYCLLKYGDTYLKLYRESDIEDEIFGDLNKQGQNKRLNEAINTHFKSEEFGNKLNENVNINLHKENDHYALHLDMVKNPAEMFELTKLGKTCGYIKAPTQMQYSTQDTAYDILLKYKTQKSDINIYPATDYVHAIFEDNNSRSTEEVSIFLDEKDTEMKDETKARTYTVNKGQSILYNTFKTWRELGLLESSVLLNRITKSSVVRTIQVEVGDMPREQVQTHLMNIKQLFEQKAGVSEGEGMQEYTNPGPVENNVYIPTHDGKGAITVANVGGDFTPGQLTDVEYYRDKLFAALRTPKQFFGFTDDAAGFNGGSSLTIISSRYGKSIKRIQNTMCQMLSDLINLFLLDRGLTSYINKFNIKMEAPVTQEEIDKRDNMSNEVRVLQDIVNLAGDITDPVLKLKMIKALLSNTITNSEVLQVYEDQIKIIEAEKEDKDKDDKKKKNKGNNEESSDLDELPISSPRATEPSPTETPTPTETEIETETETETEEPAGEESYLPSFSELGVNALNTEEQI